MRSDRARKGSGGPKDFGTGLKYSSRHEVGQGGGRRGPRGPLGPGPERSGLGPARAPQPCNAAPGHGWPTPVPVGGPDAGRAGGISCSAGAGAAAGGASRPDLWYQTCCDPATGEAEGLDREVRGSPSRPSRARVSSKLGKEAGFRSCCLRTGAVGPAKAGWGGVGGRCSVCCLRPPHEMCVAFVPPRRKTPGGPWRGALAAPEAAVWPCWAAIPRKERGPGSRGLSGKGCGTRGPGRKLKQGGVLGEKEQ